MPKPTIIPNWHYQKPSKGGYRGMKKLLKYVSYRENPEHRALNLDERWTNCGLGGNWREVYENVGRLAGPYVLAHHLVIAPAPDLMAHVPEELRLDLLRETTERVIESWHTGRGLDTPEYSYVLHDRDTSDDYEMQNLHAHVFVAGTIENGAGERESHRVGREQVVADPKSLRRADNLHHIARQEFEQILDRAVGREWRKLREVESEIVQQPTGNQDIDPDHHSEIEL